MVNEFDKTSQKLEEIKHISKNGGEYWRARDLQSALGYTSWENFEKVIQRARTACESVGISPEDQFHETMKMIEAGKGAMVPRKDYFLSRYGCYLLAMNGDPDKTEIANAQSYFAVQTRRQEIKDTLEIENKRLQLRERVKSNNKKLNSAAKMAGVQKFAVFHAAGYQGLYKMGLVDIKKRKGIQPKDDLLDRAGRAELAANDFRITQTEEKLMRDKVHSEKEAIATHHKVGSEVRSTIKKLGGIMPENLPSEPSIKTIERKRKKSAGSLPAPDPQSP
ncbi:MAG: DNA damage-inducible protein D [Nitrospira sp.]|nr:DNA damage-inducible protein D [Nitrospira sp.]